MSRINRDPHERGYVYQPIQVVTAFFTTSQGVEATLGALSAAGFSGENVDVFSGEQGAKQLDLSGEKHGAWVRFRRGLENALADETEVYQRAEQVLRAGGSVVVVFTDGGAGEKEVAAGVLKVHHGKEVTYWGNMVIEHL